MIPFVKPDSTVIDRVIYYSILQRDIKVSLFQLRQAILMIRGLRISSISSKTNELSTLEVELLRTKDELETVTRRLLEPLFEGINFGHAYFNHWTIPMRDLKRGYCELEEIVRYIQHTDKPDELVYGKKYIMLLHEYNNPTLGKFYAGELIELSKAIHFIDLIPEQKDKQKGLYDAITSSIELSMRYHRTLNTLPNV